MNAFTRKQLRQNLRQDNLEIGYLSKKASLERSLFPNITTLLPRAFISRRLKSIAWCRDKLLQTSSAKRNITS